MRHRWMMADQKDSKISILVDLIINETKKFKAIEHKKDKSLMEFADIVNNEYRDISRTKEKHEPQTQQYRKSCKLKTILKEWARKINGKESNEKKSVSDKLTFKAEVNT